MAHVMLSDIGTVVGSVVAFLQGSAGNGPLVHPPTEASDYLKFILRWGHFIFGITWIGILYFFNLINVPLMKALDGPTKGKVIPNLMPNAMWYFRWGAVGTVLVGLTYYAMYIIAVDAKNGNNNGFALLGIWLVIVLVAYAIMFFVIKPDGPTSNGNVLAVIIAVLVIAMSVAILFVLGGYDKVGNKTLCIGLGGGMGIMMLLNVWGIIWPAQKRIIAWTKANAENGTPIPPEAAKLGRRAFLASRTNAWLSIPMLFFMAASHDLIIFGR
jgi:uncharacterized membrane protein